ncbi:hypothetical protein E3N88_19155 [Mikania micrantha]|uniref:Uncharacterized protein n=1 Tax=Mikania micrantha TaxID=192012 RepID=A0A5N6NNN7_9ASTR|nr:hypothetical protein E3N88_19155 [Mikania micrantha]
MVRNRKTKFLSKNGKNWSSRYAMDKFRDRRGTRCLKISEISPDFSAVREAHFLFLRASGTFRSHPGTFIRVQIIFLSAELLRIRQSITVSKVLIRELYLVNPCAAEQEPLIVLLADNPFAGRIASPLDNGDNAVRMHLT